MNSSSIQIRLHSDIRKKPMQNLCLCSKKTFIFPKGSDQHYMFSKGVSLSRKAAAWNSLIRLQGWELFGEKGLGYTHSYCFDITKTLGVFNWLNTV